LRGNNRAPDQSYEQDSDADEEVERRRREIVRLFGEPIVKPPIFDPEVGIYPVDD
jgi:hypothetical protein